MTFLLVLLASGLLSVQDLPPTTSDNPMAVLKDQITRVLVEAQLPFSEEQEKAIILMMEDRRVASEDLFGNLMDFRAGPTQGQEADRLQSALEWMRNEFMTGVQNYLTPEQVVVWNRYRSSVQQALSTDKQADQSPPQQQTQYVRINNNIFTAEELGYRFGQGTGTQQRTEVIQRGGSGAFHGNMEFLFKDESLNARNPFARNKPPYQERQVKIDVSGPTIPGRLTTVLEVRQNEAENVDTIHASLPEGVFALGITRPALVRSLGVRNIYQLFEAHSLAVNVGYETNSSKNQGVGLFTLPERASDSKGSNWNLELKQFSNFSSHSIYETRFLMTSAHSETTPFSDAVRINVLDAFSTGGAQNLYRNTGRTYEINNLYTRLGEKLTIKAGGIGTYRTDESFSTNNFGGTFTFSSLASYVAGRPLSYRVNRGQPLATTTQLEGSLFIQNDYKVTPRLTVMFGTRYDLQTNLHDHNNFGPRLGFAYGIGQATVLRGGAGYFYNRIGMNVAEAQHRLDGTQQVEIIIDNPSYPDPFQFGNVRNPATSVRVTDPHFVAQAIAAVMMSFERTFGGNLFFSATFDFGHEVHRMRARNLNTPADITAPSPRSCRKEQSAETCVRPDPTRGNVLNLEATGSETKKSIRFNVRKRFSIFNVTGSYTGQRNYTDTTPSQVNALDQLPTDSYNLRADWGRNSQSAIHTASGTLNAQLPLGFFVAGTMSANSGRFYNIITGSDDNRDTNVDDRPPGIARNTGDAPKFVAVDFNISKAFFLGSGGQSGARSNMNVFANMTNAFNRVNYGIPSGVMSSPNFRKSTSALNSRQIELGMRYQF